MIKKLKKNILKSQGRQVGEFSSAGERECFTPMWTAAQLATLNGLGSVQRGLIYNIY